MKKKIIGYRFDKGRQKIYTVCPKCEGELLGAVESPESVKVIFYICQTCKVVYNTEDLDKAYE